MPKNNERVARTYPRTATSIWVSGRAREVILAKFSQERALVCNAGDIEVDEGQLVALKVCEHLSLPMRVWYKGGDRIGLRFERPVDRSIVQMVEEEMRKKSFGEPAHVHSRPAAVPFRAGAELRRSSHGSSMAIAASA